MSGDLPALEDQWERTLLAWRRTALSLVAVGVLVAHLVVDRVGAPAVAAVLAVLAAVVAYCWLSPQRRAAPAGLGLVCGVLALTGLALAALLTG